MYIICTSCFSLPSFVSYVHCSVVCSTEDSTSSELQGTRHKVHHKRSFSLTRVKTCCVSYAGNRVCSLYTRKPKNYEMLHAVTVCHTNFCPHNNLLCNGYKKCLTAVKVSSHSVDPQKSRRNFLVTF